MTASVWTPGTIVVTIASPSSPVQFQKGTAALPGITFQGDVDTGIWSSADGFLQFTTNGVNALTLDSLGNLSFVLGKFVSGTEVTVASAATVDLGASTSNIVAISGTNNITSFGINYKGPMYVRFTGILILSNSGTLILPSGAAITTAVGDSCTVLPKATAGVPDGWIVTAYTRANGQALAIGSDLSNTTRIDIASVSVVDLTANALNTRNINITGTNTITSFTCVVGVVYFVRFAASLTLTNSGSIVTQRGTNIITSAGDTCILRSPAANSVEILSYTSVVNKSYKSAPVISAGTLTLDLSLSEMFAVPLTGTISTITLTNIQPTGNLNVIEIEFTADGTARSVTWPAAVKWPGGTAPTLTSTLNKRDTFILYSYDAGTTWTGAVFGQNY